MTRFHLIINKLKGFELRNNSLYSVRNGVFHRVRVVTKIFYDPSKDPAEALIDTGALHSVIPGNILDGPLIEVEEIDLSKLSEDLRNSFHKLKGIAGGKIDCDFKMVSCYLIDQEGNQEIFNFPAKIDLTGTRKQPILGMMGFLERYRLFIDVTGENAFLVIP